MQTDSLESILGSQTAPVKCTALVPCVHSCVLSTRCVCGACGEEAVSSCQAEGLRGRGVINQMDPFVQLKAWGSWVVFLRVSADRCLL